jgi:hypothetical protein
VRHLRAYQCIACHDHSWFSQRGRISVAIAAQPSRTSERKVAGAGIVFTPGDQPWASHDPRWRLLVFGVEFVGASG